MATRWCHVVALALTIQMGESNAAELPYDGSREGFLGFLQQHGLTRWALPAWASTAEIGYFKAADGARLRYGHWPHAAARARGTVVHFNGRTEFIERNVLTYRDLAERGWDVWTLDWRGQGLSHRPLDASYGARGHIDSFDTYVSDAKLFVDGVVKPVRTDDRPEILLGHSMGGQIALRYMLEFQDDFDKVVLSSPLVRLPGGSLGEAVEDAKNALQVFPFLGNNCVLTKSDEWEGSFNESSCSALKSPDLNRLLRKSEITYRYTHDAANLAATECLVEQSRVGGRNQGLAVACPTGDWLVAARKSTDRAIEAGKTPTKPVLIVASKDDVVVDPEGQRKLCRTWPHCALVEVPHAGHELLVETPEIRAAFLECFDAFVADPSTGRAACEQIIATLPRRIDLGRD